MPIGYIYMISSSTGNYVGSTTRTVDERYEQHKCELYRKNRINCRSVIVLRGEEVQIKILEEIEFIDEEDTLLIQEEQKWIDMTDCVNRLRAFTPDEWKKSFRHENYIENIDKTKQRRTENNKKHNALRNGIRTNCSICGIDLSMGSLWGHNKRFHN